MFHITVQMRQSIANSCFSITESHKPVTVYLAQETDIDYQCTICTEPLREPYLSTECGHHSCQQCRDRLLSIGKPECPTCRQTDALETAVFDRNLQRKVNSLKVYCSEGCEWVGELRDVQNHLDPANGKCVIACPFSCGNKHIRSSDMKEHTRDCDKRMISCEKCGYYNTFTIVTEKHYPICNPAPRAITSATVSPQYLYNQAPIEFTIDDFSGKKQANVQWLSSPIYTHNRGYKFRLNVHPNGTGSGSHLSVYAQLMRGEYDDKLEWPFEGDIRVELLNWKEDKHHHSDTICFNRYNHTVSSTHSYRVTNQETATSLGHLEFLSHTDLEPTTNKRYLLGDYFKLRVSVAVYSIPKLLPLTPSWQGSLDTTESVAGCQFTISEYSKRKEFNNIYYSPPFTTTSPKDYKFCLKVHANGYGSGKGSHITIAVVIMKGQHDDNLKWPFTGTIIIEVLNWLKDKEHKKQILTIDTNDKIARVSKGEYGADYGLDNFIAHSSLSSTNTKYLYQDCICVRVRSS